MAILPLIIAPNDIFRTKAELVLEVNDDIRKIIDDMLDSLYHYNAMGLGANMVGILKQIIVLDLQENTQKTPIMMVNPKIIQESTDYVFMEEASLSFPGIRAEISRHRSMTVEYLDYDGEKQILAADGLLARVIYHEIDYIKGKTFLDLLSPLKRNLLLKKMENYKKISAQY